MIIIDNLDRCLPDIAVSLLESIANFFSAKNCVFFLSVDHAVLASYISSRYANTQLDGHDYLEKIVNFNVHLPDSVRRHGLGRYLAKLTRSLTQVDLPEGGCEVLADLVQGIPRLCNPRRLKKIVNRYIAFLEFIEWFHSIHDEAKKAKEIPLRNIFFGIALYHGWPDFYTRLLEQSPLKLEGDTAEKLDPDLSRLLGRCPELLNNFEPITKALYWCGIHTRFG